jgi:hypothetical protein
MKLSIGNAWSEARGVLARDGGLIALVALALLVLPGVLLGTAAPRGSAAAQAGSFSWLLPVSTVLAFIGQIAMSRIALGPALTVGEAIGVGFRRFLAFFAAFLMWILPFALTLVLLVQASGIDPEAMAEGGQPADVPIAISLAVLALTILMVVVASRMLLLTPLAAGTDLGPVAMLKRSWQLSKGRALKLFGLLLLVGLLFVLLVFGLGSAIGSVILLVTGTPEEWSIGALLLALTEGVLSAVVTVISTVLLARVYAQITASETPVSVPNAGHAD